MNLRPNSLFMNEFGVSWATWPPGTASENINSQNDSARGKPAGRDPRVRLADQITLPRIGNHDVGRIADDRVVAAVLEKWFLTIQQRVRAGDLDRPRARQLIDADLQNRGARGQQSVPGEQYRVGVQVDAMNGLKGTLDRRFTAEVRPVCAATAAVDAGGVEGFQKDVTNTAGRIDHADVLRSDLVGGQLQ